VAGWEPDGAVGGELGGALVDGPGCVVATAGGDVCEGWSLAICKNWNAPATRIAIPVTSAAMISRRVLTTAR